MIDLEALERGSRIAETHQTGTELAKSRALESWTSVYFLLNVNIFGPVNTDHIYHVYKKHWEVLMRLI